MLFRSSCFRLLPLLAIALASPTPTLSAPHKGSRAQAPAPFHAGKRARELKHAASVASIAPAVTADPPLRNWGLDNSEFPSHIEARRAWKLTQGSPEIVVAVIDTGIDANHPDLKDNLWHKAGSDEYGFDFVFGKKNPADVNGHGSHIAGIIAASAKLKKDVIGVAPKVKIMPLRYYADENTATDTVANTVKAVDYAIENGARIINYSSEGKGFNIAEYRALERAAKKGVLVVTAAGNSGENNDTADSPTYPASYDLPNIIAVAATNIRNQVLPVSNFGPARVHVAAPGESIFSTLPQGKYGFNTGTSQATAFVSGVAALMLSENPALSPVELRKIIMNTVDPSDALKRKVASGGRLNAFRAVSQAIELKKNSVAGAGAGARTVAGSRAAH